MYAENEPLRQYTHLKFPATSVVYESYNSTHINDTVRITPLCPHAAERFLFVADVGNNRITVLWKVRAHSASLVSPPFPSDMGGNVGFRYAGQFGETMVPHDDEHGMTLPWGMAVQAPAWEYPSEPVIANVFVVDKLTNRLIKLDFRYDAINSDGRSVSEWPYPAPDSYPRLVYSGEYSVGAHDNESLWEPMGVALFRHYIFVAEAQGNTIKVFTLHYSDTRAFKLVTVLYPAQGIQLTGTIAVSPIRYYDNGQSASRLGGYLWYTYHRDWTDWEMGSFFLEEALRLSTKPEEYKDFVDQCVDASTYHAMLQQGVPHFLAEVDRLCNIAHVNCRYPSSPDYVDPQLFNWTVFELQNATVFDEVSFSTCVYGYWFVGAELDEDIYPNLTVDDLVTNPNLTAELKEFTSNYWEERCFNLDVLNATIFNGRMGLCPTSAAPTPAPQDSGDDWPLVASATSRGSTSSPNAAGGAWRWRLAACLLAASWSASARASCR
ncbi:unnamed protein product [Prorocentrum cordatum]|uniref:Amine oxidase n=1 Tax=Prorocentrum cordatum TaxID=2364126 RepID=A0ABN9S6T6_9DINO|nr:unnamed protein product [Polarella glacialis]